MADGTASNRTPAPLRIHALGPLTLTLEGKHVAELHHAPQLQTLLGYLIVHRGTWVDRSRLAGTLWPDVPEDQARRSLSSNIWRLRQLGGNPLLLTLESERHAVRWHLPAGGWLDVAEWEAQRSSLALDANLDGSRTAEYLQRVGEVAALYRGPLLDGLDAPWVESLRRRYAFEYATLLRTLATGYEAAQMPAQALAWARRWVAAEPYDEHAHESVIRLHQAAGHLSAAMAAYQSYVALWEELGLPPQLTLGKLDTLAVADASTAARADPLVMALRGWVPILGSHPTNPRVQAAVKSARDSLRDAIAREARALAAQHEAAYEWELARQGYEVAVTLAESMMPSAERDAQRLELRLRLDRLYDRLALREAQRANVLQALQAAQAVGEAELLSEVWARCCWLEQQTFRLDESMYAASQALSCAGSDPALRSQALRLLGISQALSGQFRQALQSHEAALTSAEGAPGNQRLSHINLANTLVVVNRPWQAHVHARQALVGEGSRPTLVDILARGNAAVALATLGAFEQAEAHLLHARQLSAILGARLHEAWLLYRSAMLYRWLDREAEAQLWAGESLRLARDGQDELTMIGATLELAQLAGSRNDVEGALRWCDEAWASIERLGNARYRGRWLLMRAYLAAQGGDSMEAQGLAEQCASPVSESGEETLTLPLCALMAHLAAARDSHEAEQWCERARAALLAPLDQAPDDCGQQRYLQATALRRWALAAAPPPAAPPLGWLW